MNNMNDISDLLYKLTTNNKDIEFSDPTDYLDGAYEKVKLPNINNSCFINCIIQIFLHSNKLYKRLREHFGNTDLLLNTRSGYCSFTNINMNEQCSAESFLHWLLEQPKKNKSWIQKWLDIRICNECKLKTNIDREEHIWRVYPTTFTDIYTDENNNYYDYEFTECILQNSKDNLEFNCENCKLKTKHQVLNKIKYIGDNIFFSMQNFKNKSIKLYDELTIGNAGKYDLNGIVEYTGNDYFGHYTVYLLDSNGWYKYNDNKIYEVDDIYPVLENINNTVQLPLLWYVKSKE